MYYKIRNDVLFRKYQGHGYIADNSEYGYRMLNDNRRYLGEKYVSASGAVMLSMLSKSPRSIDDVIGELSQIFTGVEYEVLKQDTTEFFDLFVDEGFLSRGETTACLPCLKLFLHPEMSIWGGWERCGSAWERLFCFLRVWELPSEAFAVFISVCDPL